MFPVGSHVYLSQVKDQSSSAWLRLICEQLALLWEKKEVPFLRIVAWGLCYQLISKGGFLGDGDFHPSKRREAQAFLDAPVRSSVLSCRRAVVQCLETGLASRLLTNKGKKFMLSFNIGVKSTWYQIFIWGFPPSHQEQQQAGPQGQTTSADLWKMKLQSETGDRVSLGYLSPHCLAEKFTTHCRAKGKDSLGIKKLNQDQQLRLSQEVRLLDSGSNAEKSEKLHWKIEIRLHNSFSMLATYCLSRGMSFELLLKPA